MHSTRSSTDSDTTPVRLTPGGDRARADTARRDVSQHHPIEFDRLSVIPRVGVLVAWVRWSAVLFGALVSLARDPSGVVAWGCAASLCSFSLWQTIQRPRLDEVSARLAVLTAIELSLAVAAILLTGGIESPYVLTPMVPLMLGGYAWAAQRIVALAYAGLAVVALVGLARQGEPHSSRSGVLLGIMLLLCSVLGAFTRRLIDDAADRHNATLDQFTRMTTANDLLVSLHRLAQTLPTSLDLTEVTESLRVRLRDTFEYTALTVLVRDEFGDSWRSAIADGVRVAHTQTVSDLADPLARARLLVTPFAIADLAAEGLSGCAATARTGLYAPLWARGRVRGLIALEHTEPGRYGPDEVDLLASITSAIALSLDNAMWFNRLRVFGAETERARIARDLHDRIAQSLAYISFELERHTDAPQPPTTEELGELRDVVRSVVTDLRDTLYELRAAVGPNDDLVAVATRYLERYERRTGLTVRFEHDVSIRAPVAIEQELWRIAQEAMENAARHARASVVRLEYQSQNGRIRMAIVDDGTGFDPRQSTGDRYGLVGMRERADAIGAAFALDSAPGRGTRIQVDMEVRA